MIINKFIMIKNNNLPFKYVKKILIIQSISFLRLMKLYLLKIMNNP